MPSKNKLLKQKKKEEQKEKAEEETCENDTINNLFVRKNAVQSIEVTDLGRELGVSFIPDLNNSDIYPNLWSRRLSRMMTVMPPEPDDIDTTSPDFITISKAKSVEQIQEMMDIVSKQTEYDKTEIIRKLIEHDYNIEDVIKDYNNLIEHRKMLWNKFEKDNKTLDKFS